MTDRRTEPSDWPRFAGCHICTAEAGQPCRNLLPTRAGELLERAHPERVLEVDRNPAGAMLLGRREHVTSSRPGTTHGAHAHHACIDGVAVCCGALVSLDTLHPLDALSRSERCQRHSCKRLWTFEELMA